MLNRFLAAAFVLALSSMNASASDCWGNLTGTQADCGVVNMYLDANSKAVPVTPTTPLPLGIYGNGSAAQVSLDGALSVNTPASPQFQDSFSAALDTTTNWTAKNSTGTAATSSGQLVINSSTTASAWGGVSTQQTFAPVGVGSQAWGVLASFTVLAQANSVRVFGVFTVPATPTTAVPVTDGYIYRLDGTGALFAEIWSAGVAVSSTNVTTACLPAANFPGIFAIVYRASLVQFTCGSALVVNQAPILGINPANQVLPLSALSIAGATPPAASAVMNLSALALAVISPGAVKSANQIPTINDPMAVVGLSPNSAGIITTGTAGAASAQVVTTQGVAGMTPYLVNTEGVKTTYSFGVAALVPAAAATDIACLTGSASKTMRVTRVQLSGIATAASAADVVLLKRSTANSGGTSAAPTLVPNDSTNVAASGTALTYTANPTPGTLVGNVRSQKMTLTTAAGAIPVVPAIFDFTTNNSQAVVLRGTAQSLCVNWNGQTIAGNSLDLDMQWTEE